MSAGGDNSSLNPVTKRWGAAGGHPVQMTEAPVGGWFNVEAQI